MTGKTVAAVFHIAERRFEADGGGGSPTAGKTSSATLPDGIDFGMFDIYHQDYSESETARIFFNPDGTCDDGVVIALVGRGDKQFITLDFATGMPTARAEFK